MLPCYQHVLLSAVIEKDLGFYRKSYTEPDGIILEKKGKKKGCSGYVWQCLSRSKLFFGSLI